MRSALVKLCKPLVLGNKGPRTALLPIPPAGAPAGPIFALSLRWTLTGLNARSPARGWFAEFKPKRRVSAEPWRRPQTGQTAYATDASAAPLP